MRKKWLFFISLSLFIGMLSACQSKEETSQASQTLTVEDSQGKVTLPKQPEKVVVFDNGSLDTLDALGVGEKVVGVPTKNLPSYLSAYQDCASVGGLKEPDLEKINELQPDLIIISGRQKDFQEELANIAPTMYLAVDQQDPWASTLKNIQTLGKVFAQEKLAEEKIATLTEEKDALFQKAQTTGQKALVVLLNEGQLSAYGSGSRFGIVHDAFGFAQADDQIQASTHGQSVSFEYVLEKNPDILFVVDRTQAIGGDTTNDQIQENALVKQTNAGKNEQVIFLQPDVWYLSGGGLESTHLMLEEIAAAL